MTQDEAAWLAGLLEGEGFFGIDAYRRTGRSVGRPVLCIRLQMCDRDVVERAVQLAPNATRYIGVLHREPGSNRLDVYRVGWNGRQAEELMRAVRPWMGQRRGDKIDDLLATENLSHR